MRKSFTRLSVIIPVYNHTRAIRDVVESVLAVDIPLDLDVILVHDGSRGDIVDELELPEGSPVRVVAGGGGFGRGKAVRTGLTLAKGDVILIQDADFEVDSEDYRSLLSPIPEKVSHVVYGGRLSENSSSSAAYSLSNRVATGLANILFGIKLSDVGTPQKAFTIDVAENLYLRSDGVEVDAEITAQVARLGLDIVEIPIPERPRDARIRNVSRIDDVVRFVITLIKCRFSRRYSGRRKREPNYA